MNELENAAYLRTFRRNLHHSPVARPVAVRSPGCSRQARLDDDLDVLRGDA